MPTQNTEVIQNMRLDDDASRLVIVDQTLLPQKLAYLALSTREEFYTAIKTLQVRGAPAIGIFAGYAMYLLAKDQQCAISYDEFKKRFLLDAAYLDSSRPTAANLSWALRRMEQVVQMHDKINDALPALRAEAIAIHGEDIDMCTKISRHGLSLLKDGDTILTHCNAGPLATSRYGTALGPIMLGHDEGMRFHVYADETRPLLQGARLTSYELAKAGIDVTLICDNMASLVMKQGKINAVFVGCDRIAANGDFANKIGTSAVAILARYYGIPFYTLGPSSTIDFTAASGDDIEIELRNEDEIKSMWFKEPMALDEVKCYNPSFDVTDHSLLTAIITEKGIVYPPFDINLRKLFIQ